MDYCLKDIISVLYQSIDEIMVSKEELTEIDSKLGDGDMGISMEKGAIALKKELDKFVDSDINISELFMNCAMAFNRAAPSTMGTLLSGGMLAIAKQIGNQKVITIDQVVEIPGILANSISLRGKASVGDKTVLDALIPFSDKLKSVYNETMSIDKALTMATQAAYIGMESTKGIIAKTGRAKWLAERNMEYPDAGSVLCYRIVKRIELTHKN